MQCIIQPGPLLWCWRCRLIQHSYCLILYLSKTIIFLVMEPNRAKAYVLYGA